MIRLCAFADEAAPDLAGQIAALQQNNISLLELRSVDKVNVKDLNEQTARRMAAALRRAGIAVWSLGSPLGKCGLDEDPAAFLESVHHVCRLAGIFGARYVRVFSFFDALQREKEVLARLRKMVAIAAGYGVTLCHENEKKIFGDTEERVGRLLNGVPGLGSVYDPANFLQVGERADATLSHLAHRATYYHIKDLIAATGEMVPAGYGDGQIDRLIGGIRDDRVLTLEPHLAVFDAYRTIDDSALKTKFRFADSRAAFNAAAEALKALLRQAGYHETRGGFIL